jgi:hypothetical protein
LIELTFHVAIRISAAWRRAPALSTAFSWKGQIGQFLERHACDLRVIERLAIAALPSGIFIRTASDEFEYSPFGYHGGNSFSQPSASPHLQFVWSFEIADCRKTEWNI